MDDANTIVIMHSTVAQCCDDEFQVDRFIKFMGETAKNQGLFGLQTRPRA